MNDLRRMSNEYIIKRAQIGSVQSSSTNSSTQSTGSASSASFGDVLQKVQSDQNVKFSKHALDRLNARQIDLTDSDITRINNAVEQADKKGVREALILMDDKVFIASVKNKTIITAATDDQLKENVFTNIDGAVII
jgi:flagellar operon protein